jgi:hypothetical protein
MNQTASDLATGGLCSFVHCFDLCWLYDLCVSSISVDCMLCLQVVRETFFVCFSSDC